MVIEIGHNGAAALVPGTSARGNDGKDQSLRTSSILDEIRETFAGRTVLVTGHSGFKGSWLTCWLAQLGAVVVGVSLPPEQGADNLFDGAKIGNLCDQSYWCDIRDYDLLLDIFRRHKPSIVVHLAAQALVRRAYGNPLETFSSNVMGTAHVLEAARQTSSVGALLCVTTDKVYSNQEWHWPYRESDALGGIDPYSASKGAAELVARTYMMTLRDPSRSYALATARGGNVIGGGDWSTDRIVPDIVRSIRAGEALQLRSPLAIRPWQHVLELCYGYLVLATRLYHGWPARKAGPEAFIGAFNFGPEATNEVTVETIANSFLRAWGKASYPIEVGSSKLHESTYLRLDSSKARQEIGWRPLLAFDETIELTANWYRRYLAGEDAANLLKEQIDRYEQLIKAIAAQS